MVSFGTYDHARSAGHIINQPAFTNRHLRDSPNPYHPTVTKARWGNPCHPFKKRIEDKDKGQIWDGIGAVRSGEALESQPAKNLCPVFWGRTPQ